MDETTPFTILFVGKFPHDLRPSPDGKWVYVANAKDTTLSVIDTATNTKVADIEVGQRPVQVGFAPDGKFVYFSLNAENAIGKVDVATRQLVWLVCERASAATARPPPPVRRRPR